MGKRILGVLAAMVALAGCTDSPSTSTEPTTAAPVVTSAPPAEIPATAFLQIADLGKDGMLDPDVPPTDATLSPCGDALPSEASVALRKAIRVTYHFTPDEIPNGTAHQVITRYSAGGAAAYLADLRAAVGKCPEFERKSDIEVIKHAVAAENFAGDESVMVSRLVSTVFEGELMEDTGLIAAVRIDDSVLVLDVQGWELESADRGHVDRLVAAAVTRAAALG